MNGINKVIIVGNAGSKPELKKTQNGHVTNFSVATNESWKGANGKETRTEWHRLTMYNKLAEIACELIDKGSKVYVEGSIRSSKWNDAQGVEKESKEIVCQVMQALDYKADRTDAGNQQAYASKLPPEKQPPSFDDFPDDDLPF